MDKFTGFKGVATLVDCPDGPAFLVTRDMPAMADTFAYLFPNEEFDPLRCKPAIVISPEVIEGGKAA